MERPAADPFSDTFVAMAVARTVITATQLGVIAALADQPSTARVLADRLHLDPVGTEALLTALVTLGYVDETLESVFAPTEAGMRVVPGAPRSITHFIGAYNANAWQMLDGLDDALKGQRSPASHQRPRDDPFWEAYIRGLFELTREQAEEAARLTDIHDPRQMIDIGGGHGGFAMAMCARHPQLTATVLDLPGSAAIGRKIVAEEGFDTRVHFSEGDALQSDLGSDLDVVSMVNVLHHLPAVAAQQLLSAAHASLRAGGCLVIGETERTEPGQPASLHGAMSGLVYFASSGARNYSKRELTEWITTAGFSGLVVHRSESAPWRLLYVAHTAEQDT
jgi:SAM-dependent methyltransferase